MNALLMAALLSAVPGEEPGAKAGDMPDVNGSWLIVYAEEKGRRIQKWEQVKATIKDGALTYERDKKDYTITLKFGPHQTLKATTGGKDEKPADGVYIAGQDYLCISLVGGAFAEGGKAGGGKEDKDEKKADEPKAGKSSGDFILILRKQREPK